MHGAGPCRANDVELNIELTDLTVLTVDDRLSEIHSRDCGMVNYTFTLTAEPTPDDELLALSA